MSNQNQSNKPGQPFGGVAVPPPAVGSNVPAPILGGGVAPPPALGANVPAPFLGKPQLDVAPPPFMTKKKKEKVIRRIVEEVYEDVGPIIDPKAKARRRMTIILSLVISLPVFLGMFYIGKSRQSWALTDKSRVDATKLLETVNKARPILEQVQAKTGAALTKAKANQIDSGFLNYARDMNENRPITNSDVDMLNYAAFDAATVDLGFELMRATERLWGQMSSHRGLTRPDTKALQSVSKMGGSARQNYFGVVLMLLDPMTFGANIGIVSNPGVDDDGAATLDLQVRTGRMPHSVKRYTSGAFGEKINQWVIPVDPAQTGPGGGMEKSGESHMDLYIHRLRDLSKLAGTAVQLQGQLAQKLQAVSGG